MYLSTRDMARVGVLMPSDGKWNGKQVMPKGWARAVTTLVTPHLCTRRSFIYAHGKACGVTGCYGGCGMRRRRCRGRLRDRSRGIQRNGGEWHFITVLSAMEMVVVHKVDFDADGSRQVGPDDFHAILSRVISSGGSGPGCG